eukprot:jgi/Mesvir1/23626/Mv18302-RA.1
MAEDGRHLGGTQEMDVTVEIAKAQGEAQGGQSELVGAANPSQEKGASDAQVAGKPAEPAARSWWGAWPEGQRAAMGGDEGELGHTAPLALTAVIPPPEWVALDEGGRKRPYADAPAAGPGGTDDSGSEPSSGPSKKRTRSLEHVGSDTAPLGTLTATLPVVATAEMFDTAACGMVGGDGDNFLPVALESCQPGGGSDDKEVGARGVAGTEGARDRDGDDGGSGGVRSPAQEDGEERSDTCIAGSGGVAGSSTEGGEGELNDDGVSGAVGKGRAAPGSGDEVPDCVTSSLQDHQPVSQGKSRSSADASLPWDAPVGDDVSRGQGGGSRDVQPRSHADKDGHDVVGGDADEQAVSDENPHAPEPAAGLPAQTNAAPKSGLSGSLRSSPSPTSDHGAMSSDEEVCSDEDEADLRHGVHSDPDLGHRHTSHSQGIAVHATL